MKIEKRRIRSLDKYLSSVKDDNFYIGVPVDSEKEQILVRVGFSSDLIVGETVCPSNSFGPISKFNSNGKNIKFKDRPMETAYRQSEWHWKTFDGAEHSKIVDIPYPRYPREFIDPPSIEFKLIQKDNNRLMIAGDKVNKLNSSPDMVLHTINLCLEIFGEVHLLNSDFDFFEIPNPIKMNWEILPPGEYPWERLQIQLTNVFSEVKKGNKPVISSRLEYISNFKPDAIYSGRAGFHGYLVFEFKEFDLFIFESSLYGNATYVFEGAWEQLSQMTKAEILSLNLCKERFIHREGWEHNIKLLFNKTVTV